MCKYKPNNRNKIKSFNITYAFVAQIFLKLISISSNLTGSTKKNKSYNVWKILIKLTWSILISNWCLFNVHLTSIDSQLKRILLGESLQSFEFVFYVFIIICYNQAPTRLAYQQNYKQTPITSDPFIRICTKNKCNNEWHMAPDIALIFETERLIENKNNLQNWTQCHS